MRLFLVLWIVAGCGGDDQPTDSASPSPVVDPCIAAWQDTAFDLDERQFAYAAYDGEKIWLTSYGLIDGIVKHHDLGTVGCDGVRDGEPTDIRYRTVQWRTRMASSGDAVIGVTPRLATDGSPQLDIRPRSTADGTNGVVELPLEHRDLISFEVGEGRDGFVLAHTTETGAAVRHMDVDGVADSIIAELPLAAQEWIRFAEDDGTHVYVGTAIASGATFRINDNGVVEVMDPRPLRVAAKPDGRRIEMYGGQNSWTFVDQDGNRLDYDGLIATTWPVLAIGENRTFAAVQDRPTGLVQVLAFDDDLGVVGTADAPNMIVPSDLAVVDDNHAIVTGRTSTINRISVQMLTIRE